MIINWFESHLEDKQNSPKATRDKARNFKGAEPPAI